MPASNAIHTVSCIDCGAPFACRSSKALRCPRCFEINRKKRQARYTKQYKKKQGLMPEQVAVIESLILANDLSDRAISEELATRGITASKECVASRRRRLGMSHDLTSLPVLVKAATILEATRTLSQGIVVDFTPPIPAIPTNAPPGSRRKVAVLAERIRSGMPLWHTEDCHVMEPPSD